MGELPLGQAPSLVEQAIEIVAQDAGQRRRCLRDEVGAHRVTRWQRHAAEDERGRPVAIVLDEGPQERTEREIDCGSILR